MLQDALRRVEDWPEAAQVELAEIALEIEAGLGFSLCPPPPSPLFKSVGRCQSSDAVGE
jgi:hypothetical protein